MKNRGGSGNARRKNHRILLNRLSRLSQVKRTSFHAPHENRGVVAGGSIGCRARVSPVWRNWWRWMLKMLCVQSMPFRWANVQKSEPKRPNLRKGLLCDDRGPMCHLPKALRLCQFEPLKWIAGQLYIIITIGLKSHIDSNRGMMSPSYPAKQFHPYNTH